MNTTALKEQNDSVLWRFEEIANRDAASLTSDDIRFVMGLATILEHVVDEPSSIEPPLTPVDERYGCDRVEPNWDEDEHVPGANSGRSPQLPDGFELV